jgi:hypothetical protein
MSSRRAPGESTDRLIGNGREPSPELVAVLADRIADLLAERLQAQLGQLLTDRRLDAAIQPPSSKIQKPPASKCRPVAKTEGGLWSAREIARHYGVTVNFVYQHANELGCIRLGGGNCARLRFDPDVVQARWAQVGGALPSERPRRRRSQPRRRRTIRHSDAEFLLEFEREP